MSDVSYGEKSKKVLRLLLKLGLKYLKLDLKMIEENLGRAPNPVVKNLNTILIVGSNQLKSDWQRKSLKCFGQIGLWIGLKDTGYRDAFFWILYQILKKADKLLIMIEPYVKPPEDWYPNLWIDGRDKTRQLRKEGKIVAYEKSFEESIFVPAMQKERHKKLQKK